MSEAQSANSTLTSARAPRYRQRRPRRGAHPNGTPREPEPPDPSVHAGIGDSSPQHSDGAPHLRENHASTRLQSGDNLRTRRGRGARYGVASQTVTGRAFGAQLTDLAQQGELSSISVAALQADAPEFRPGQPVPVRNHVDMKSIRPRRTSKSVASDIATRIHEDIANRFYECAICTSEVLRNSKIWSCKTCWTVFHLSCITKWSKNEGSTQQRQQNGDIAQPRQWRCPGCNLPKDDMPNAYTCWCGKDVDPKPLHGVRPHSCGQTCGQLRPSRLTPSVKCPHPCEEQCHAGPCPPCSRNGPVQRCFCGRNALAKRCMETDYEGGGWTCDLVCGDIMPCNEHKCPRSCHEGLCGSCEVLVDSRCYCGKVEKPLTCSDQKEQLESHLRDTESLDGPDAISSSIESSFLVQGGVADATGRAGESNETCSTKTWIGSFTCQNSCGRLFDCGKHTCMKACHQQKANPAHCPLSPDVITHCPCGKTPLVDIGCKRVACQEPVPHCTETCQKSLPCGHLCPQKCHSGECMPCLATISIKCRCGRTSSPTVCHQGAEEPPQCMRPCKALLNCGRHECAEKCCPAEKVASDRQAARRKLRALNSARGIENDFEAEHICTRTCGRPLKCGNASHTCQELCHRGPCSSCREAIFDEIACNCGRTVLQPPLPCGTGLPSCQYPCRRPKPCGHPIVSHTCHEDDICPKCPYLVQKTCMCGKSVLKNQPCWSTQVSCGQTCCRRLICGIHFCQKTCHRDGKCEDADSRSCPQICGQRKIACDHFCLAQCHAPYSCKEDKPCQSKVIITCECGRNKQEVRCLAAKSDDTCSTRKSLNCDDECHRLSRNRKLAQALNIDPGHLNSEHIPYSSTTLDMFQGDVKWSQMQEREFRVFADDDTERRLRFKPMKSHQRAFLHALAEDFGFDSESLDPEPHRHIIIFKTPRFVSAPTKTLAQCIKSRAAVPVPPTGPKITESTEPYNALVLISPKFALTLDELRTHIRNDLGTISHQSFSISFLPSEEIVVHEHSTRYDNQGGSIDFASLTRLKILVLKTVTSQKLASGVALCRIDQSLNILRREHDMSTEGGWSQVVKGAAIKTKTLELNSGARNSFTVLGTKVPLAKVSKERENVVDDWENEVYD